MDDEEFVREIEDEDGKRYARMELPIPHDDCGPYYVLVPLD